MLLYQLTRLTSAADDTDAYTLLVEEKDGRRFEIGSVEICFESDNVILKEGRAE